MNLKAKLVGNEDERAVSPVIGVILMVAITVILAAVIAAFVLDLGQGTGPNASAGVSFDGPDDDVTVTITSIDRADEIEYSEDDGSSWDEIGNSEVGDSEDSIDSESDGIIVRAEYDSDQAVIATYNR